LDFFILHTVLQKPFHIANATNYLDIQILQDNN